MKGKEEEVEKQREMIADFEKEIELVEIAFAEERDRQRDAKKTAWEVEKKALTAETWVQKVVSRTLIEF